MPVTNSEYLAMRRAPIGRRLFALGQVRDEVDPTPGSGLLKLIDKALKWDRHTRQLERRWEHVKTTTVTRGDAILIDAKQDRSISALFQIFDGQSKSPDTKKAEAAQTIKKKIFPLGVGAVTRLPYEQQHSTVVSILEDLRGELADKVKILDLGTHIDHIAVTNDEL